MRRLAVVLLCLFALGACSDDDDGGSGGADATTTTSAAAAMTTTTTASAAPSAPAKSPDAAAQGLFDAWQDGDREGASRFAKPAPINELFSHPNTKDTAYDDQGCAPQGGQFVCSWTYPGGVLQMTVEALAGGGFVVDDITYIAD